MSSKYAVGMGKNSKRKVRRNLCNRLSMAERDAARSHGHYEEQRSPRFRPTRAAYLDAKTEPKSEPEASDKEGATSGGAAVVVAVGARDPDGVPSRNRSRSPVGRKSEDELDASAYMGEQVDSSDAEADARDELQRLDGQRAGASEWMERGRLAKEKRDLHQVGRQHHGVRLRSAEAGRRREPPWRAAGSHGFDEGPLRGVRYVLPRWKVEAALEREEQTQEPNTTLLSKVATQLLRWGRSDVDGVGGIRSVQLPNWTPTAWYTIAELAAAMQVHVDQLPTELLLSEGRHGPRILYKESDGLEALVKARWTGRENQQHEGRRGRRHGGDREQRAQRGLRRGGR
jgi:hypothetical protein